MKNVLQFLTPEHPKFRRWGGASPMLARDVPGGLTLESNEYQKLSRSKVMRMWKKADLSEAAVQKTNTKYLNTASWLKRIPAFLGIEKKRENKDNGTISNRVIAKENVKEVVDQKTKRKRQKPPSSKDTRFALSAYNPSLFCASSIGPVIVAIPVL